jgi:hypothetical protein
MPICAIRKQKRIQESTGYCFLLRKDEEPTGYLSVHLVVRGLIGEGADIAFVHVLSVWFKCCSRLGNDRIACTVCTRSDVCTVE